jgi:hypothetical protein
LGTLNFPPKSKHPENLASLKHTVRLVPHHISRPRNAGLCGFWGLETREKSKSLFGRNAQKMSTLENLGLLASPHFSVFMIQ